MGLCERHKCAESWKILTRDMYFLQTSQYLCIAITNLGILHQKQIQTPSECYIWNIQNHIRFHNSLAFLTHMFYLYAVGVFTKYIGMRNVLYCSDCTNHVECFEKSSPPYYRVLTNPAGHTVCAFH